MGYEFTFTDELAEIIERVVFESPEKVQNTLYGCYTICVKCRNNDWYVFNDLLSKMSVYYAFVPNGFIFSNSFFECAEKAKSLGLDLTLDRLGIKMMNEHHIFYDDITYLNEIKFLKPFQYISIISGCVKVQDLDIPSTDYSTVEAKAIDECHKRFDEGTRLQYSFNKNRGFKQVVTLSGGMDSRTTYLYENKINKEGDELLFSYAEANSVDFEFPLTVCEKERKEFFFHSMRNGQFLINRDDMALRNEGQYNYAGTTGMCESLSMYDVRNWGLVHTGLGGGEIMGDICSSNEKLVWNNFINLMASSDADRKRLEEIKNKYESYNQFSNLNDIRRCLNSQKIGKSFKVEYCSPFLFEPFFLFMLTVPYKLKADRKLYLKWIERYCPTKYKSTYKLGAKSDISYFCKRVVHHLIVKMWGKTKYDMNPFQNWEKNNPSMVESLDRLFEEDKTIIQQSLTKDVAEGLKKDWESSSLLQKTYLLTSTWAIREIITKGLL